MKARQIGKFFVLLNGINDVAYFTFLILQFLLLDATLKTLLHKEHEAMSVGLTMTLIASQLLWQVVAEGPTGALADGYGRAWAIAMSFWCRLIAVALVVICVVAGLNYDSPVALRAAVAVALILAQALTASGEAFLEGSIEAWLRDETESSAPKHHKKFVNKAFERSALVQNAAILVTTVIVLLIWQLWGKWVGVALLVVSACLFVAGALISHTLIARETYKGTAAGTRSLALRVLPQYLWAGRVILLKLRDASVSLLRTNDRSVRRLIAILILPFPCWVILSWFYPAFGKPSSAGDAATLPPYYAVLLGGTLGVARTLGAWLGKRLSSNEEEKYLHSVCEKAVFINLIFLFGAALFLMLRFLVEGGFFSSISVLLFLFSAALAKGAEEVVKLTKNKFLASALPDAEIRATTLSFVSVVQNAFGFIAITLSSMLAFIVTNSEGRQPAIIFAACALAGVVGWLIYLGSKLLSKALRSRAARREVAT
jgi:MFS family permease